MNFHPGEIYFDGRWRTADGTTYPVIDPTTEEVLGHALDTSPEDVARAAASARRAHESGVWSALSVDERIASLSRVFDLLADRKEEFAQIQTAQMGAPITLSRALAGGVVGLFRAHAAAGTSIQYRYLRRDAGGQSLVTMIPVGVVGFIIPWNGPLAAIVSHVLPALIAGCTVVVKPSPETPLEAGLFAELFTEAGIPDGVFNVVTGGAIPGEALVVDPSVDMISFTGSTATGRRVAELAGAHLKRVSLELGGKSAGILLPDADLTTAIPAIVNSSFGNSGQVCVAVTRVLVPDSRYDEILDGLVALASERVVGNPYDDSTQLGPLVTAAARDRVQGFVDAAQHAGAKLVLGGARPVQFDKGWFFEPTIFGDVDNSMDLAQHEVFGPVMSVIRYTDQAQAIDIANDSRYGLHGAVFSSDTANALAVAQSFESGSVAINSAGLTPGTPYGGRKESGTGREHGREGLAEFLQTQSFVIPKDLGDRLEAEGLPVS